MRLLPFVVTLLAACKTEAPPADVPTYYADVKPLIDVHCARCHTDNGIGPVSFDDVASVLALGPSMIAQIDAGNMPPPAPDPSCADYEGSDAMTLSDDERAVFTAWVDANMPLGEPADAPAPPAPATVGPFDVELHGLPFTPTFNDAQAPGNEYRCFAFKFASDTDKFATALEAVIDQTPIVHHVVLFRDTTRTADVTDTDGFDCDGLGEDGWDILAAWGPGSLPVVLPEGAGVRIPAHDRLVVQMHYFDSGRDFTADSTGYGLLLTDSVETEVAYLPFGGYNFTIPAGDPAYEVEQTTHWPSGQGHPVLYSAWPHMHVLGKQLSLEITHPDDTKTCVLRMNDWNFHDQATAPLLTPIPIKAGDDITVRCTYDNSAGTSDVEFGEGTQNEMCFAFTYAGF